AGAYSKVTAALKKLKGDKFRDQRITKLVAAQTDPVFEGTKYADTIKKSIKSERDGKAKVPYGKLQTRIKKKKPAEQLAALTGALSEPDYAGTSYLDRMKDQIKSIREKQLASKFAALKARVKKDATRQLRIATLRGALPTYSGTKFEKTINGMIQSEKDAGDKERFGKLTNEIKKLPPLRKIERLKAAQAEFASSKKYKASVDKLLEKTEASLEKSIYGAIQKEVKGAKTDAAKVQILERRKGDLKSTTYTKKIDAQIKKLNAAITKAAQVKKDKALKASYDKLMKEIGVKGMKSPQKISILETKKATFAGSSFAKKIDDQIKKLNKGLAAEAEKEREAKAKKVFDAIKLVKAKTTADCDANIAKLQDAKFQVGKTSYAKKIDSLITKERKTKAKIEKSKKTPK
ncbi:MAG: hypothetical protein ACYTAF_16335, partial [Planctomycetota bacterium]